MQAATHIITYELLSNNESLCQPIRTWLLCVFEMYAIIRAVTKQTLKAWQVIRCTNDENILNPSKH